MILFFPAIDGSGSNFALNLLRDLYDPKFYYHLDDENTVLRMIDKPIRHLVHTGFHFEKVASENGLYVPIAKVEEWLERADRIICSIRDPLKVLETNVTMGYKQGNPVDKFLAYADWSQRFDMFFIPVDINLSFNTPGIMLRTKRGHIISTLSHYLSMPLNLSVMYKWAKEWPVVNDSKKFRPRKEPDKKMIEYLIEHRNVLKPFLENIGYRKLSWWKS